MIEINKIAKFLPTVKKPDYKIPLNKKLMWTGLVLVLYFMLSSPLFGHVYGVESVAFQQFQTLQMLLGSSFGTLMTLGIGPIVTASILLQLLVGSKIINWDMNKPEEREKFQTTQKVASLTLCFVEAIVYVIAGAVLPASRDVITMSAVIFQLALGGVIVMMLDELISKYGVGSGISLFIAAGVINTIFIQTFSFCVPISTGGCSLPSLGVEPIGRFWAFLINLMGGQWFAAISNILPIISTIAVFLVVIYAQSITVDIPLTFSAVRGFGRRWSLNLFYTSNIPVILAAALLANMQLVASMAATDASTPGLRCGVLGCFAETQQGNQPISGAIYYLSAPNTNVIVDIIAGTFTSSLLIRIITYTVFLTVGCIIFSVFWVATSGMDSESVAKQITDIGMQIPGYRKNPRVIKSVLDRYISPLAVVGGASIGLLASIADLLGAFGSGTGILLTVTILYSLYQALKTEKTETAHPIVKRILGGD